MNYSTTEMRCFYNERNQLLDKQRLRPLSIMETHRLEFLNKVLANEVLSE